MDEDKFALVEKILKDIDNVMSKNPELCSFEIVPVEANFQNKSPVLHLEDCLGLESWCVKHVYMYCYTELMDKYLMKPKRKPFKVTSMISERLTRLLNITLLLNPELTTLWNRRRELVLKMMRNRSAELQFAKIVLSRKPKCNDAFAYRRWLLDGILQGENLQSNYIENLANEELQLCQTTSDQSPNNYHSWNHRMWLMNKLKHLEKQFDLDFLYKKEFEFSEHFASTHISDFSCFHYRQFCINNIFTVSNERWKTFEISLSRNLRKRFVSVLAANFPKDAMIQASEDDLISYSEDNMVHLLLSKPIKNCTCYTNNVLVCRKFEVLFNELAGNNELIEFYKSHETLWYHRRFIIHELIDAIYDYHGLVRQNGALVKKICRKCNGHELEEKKAKIGRYDGDRVYSNVLFKVISTHEMKFVQAQKVYSDKYADRHEQYLKFVEGLKNVF